MTPSLLPLAPARFSAQSAPAAPSVAPDWPREFGLAELTSLAQAALAGNFDIAAASDRILQADASAKLAAATLYPTLQGTSNDSRSFSPGTARFKEPPFRTSASNLLSLGVSASYALDFFGHNEQGALAARRNALASRYDHDTLALTTIASLVNSYFGVLGAQDRLRIARENIRTSSSLLDAIKARLSVGTATELDVAQQENVVASQRAGVPQLEQTVQQGRNTIALLVGVTPESLTIRGGSLEPVRMPAIRPGLPAQVLRRRPDIAAAEARLEAGNASVKQARAAFFPTITLTGQGSFESLVVQNLFRPEAFAGSMAAGFVQPIFNGYSLDAQLENAQGRYRELLDDYRKSIIQALTDVENALIAMRQTGQRVILQTQVVAAATRAYQITEARLREGTIDVVTLLNTEQSLFQAQDTLAQARLARAQAYVGLYQALGGGWTGPLDELLPREAADAGRAVAQTESVH